jgi:predicted kinase
MLALCPPGNHVPMVLALMGLPGAGKSTLARLLAESTRWPILNRDEIRAERSPGDASVAARLDADAILLRRVGSGVRAALNLIVDGKSFASAADRWALAEAVDDAGGQLQWCWLDLPPELAIARIDAERAHPTASLVSAVAARFEPPDSACWHLDAQLPSALILQQLLLLLAEHFGAIVIDDH